MILILRNTIIILLVLVLTACSSQPPTIDSLPDNPVKLKRPTTYKNKVDRNKAITHYRQFLKLAPGSAMYHQAFLRLAELELENIEDYISSGKRHSQKRVDRLVDHTIKLYKTYLKTYPGAANNDQILYALARAHEIKGDTRKTLRTLSKLTQKFPDSPYFEEAHFRRGEILFAKQRYAQAEKEFYIVGFMKNSIYKDKALYKYSWSKFKQSQYHAALNSFFTLIDDKQNSVFTKGLELPVNISKNEKEFIEDIMRSISLTVSYLDGVKTLSKYMSRHSAQQYEPLLYNQLGNLYFDKKRYIDAADTYLAYTNIRPTSLLAPDFYEKAINVYQKAGLRNLTLTAKTVFVQRYGQDSQFWQLHHSFVHNKVRLKLKQHVKDLATHYHSQYRSSHKKSHHVKAAYWYDYYIQSFPNDPNTSKVNFLLADLYSETKQYKYAIREFEKTAYAYPSHNKSSEAAYAALLLYPLAEKKLPASKIHDWQLTEINSALNFAENFSHDIRARKVLTKTAEKLYQLKDYKRTRQITEKLIASFTSSATSKNNSDSIDEKPMRQTVWTVHGHINFDTGNFISAEKSYKTVLHLNPGKNRPQITERLAASIYKQGEQAQQTKQTDKAIHHFLRVQKTAPKSSIRWTADYDAASLLIQANRWSRAQPLLEGLRKHYSKKHKLQLSITEKLAYIYSKTGQTYKAAQEMEKLALKKGDKDYKREMLWQAAELYHKGNYLKDSTRLYRNYVKLYPQYFDRTLEAKQILAQYYMNKGDTKQAHQWYKTIIKQDKKGGVQRTERSRYLAASANLILARPLYLTYKKSKLTIPLKKSLQHKKKLMKKTINAYQKAIDYQITDVTTSATYTVAEIYNDFSRSLMKSQRPAKLKGEALEQYDILLEEQAFPFEEKAISIHQANLKYLPNEVWDKWVKKSLLELRKLQPIRYAKTERVEKYVPGMY